MLCVGDQLESFILSFVLLRLLRRLSRYNRPWVKHFATGTDGARDGNAMFWTSVPWLTKTLRRRLGQLLRQRQPITVKTLRRHGNCDCCVRRCGVTCHLVRCFAAHAAGDTSCIMSVSDPGYDVDLQTEVGFAGPCIQHSAP